MQLFYNSEIDANRDTFTFDKDESKHIARVLRKKEGDLLHITNGKGALFTATITLADQKRCEVAITKVEQHAARKYHLHLAVAPTKMNERFEWFLEKATEIGVTEITPILCHHSERKVIKPERFEKVLQSAMKQSLQTYLPKLNPLTPLTDFIATHESTQKFIAHCEEWDKKELKDLAKPNCSSTILIGPEGDFSPEEIEQSLKNGYKAVALGKNRLRTETAAIFTAATMALLNN
ncbi:16S rRNA (uracil(1498)-N(3))-methyltransferase [Croceivirga sp. JEA036]|uniref:16S rRNA (uracil(1498)-N(3))-methyltransferase n=1 Tax=Croceivirga sp. JEA036 TaxID=2721162 RepID=UPI00143B3EF9|nr:16S rRNA (uracil(1498)-N(3))-methyltransferase [Croceivirga sp. JEA036]NJB35342.1 16S rRNA (uracil(1498)-N(3))-methyltransferase [Croceivirga sp. JEA036]